MAAVQSAFTSAGPPAGPTSASSSSECARTVGEQAGLGLGGDQHLEHPGLVGVLQAVAATNERLGGLQRAGLVPEHAEAAREMAAGAREQDRHPGRLGVGGRAPDSGATCTRPTDRTRPARSARVPARHAGREGGGRTGLVEDLLA